MNSSRAEFKIDKDIHDFMKTATGGTWRDTVIGSKLLVAAGLASSQVTLTNDLVVISVSATPRLRERLETLKNASWER